MPALHLNEFYRTTFRKTLYTTVEALQYDLGNGLLIATDAQETRDMIRILANLYKSRGEVAPVLTAADFRLDDDASGIDTGPFVPPVALQINSPHGARLLALDRRKWRSQGGYPTLTHGGLSLLEVLSPFVELSRTGG